MLWLSCTAEAMKATMTDVGGVNRNGAEEQVNQRWWESWGKDAFIATAVNTVFLFASAAYGAYQSGTPLRHPFTGQSFIGLLHVLVPIWLVLLSSTFLAATATLYARERRARRIAALSAAEALVQRDDLTQRFYALQGCPKPQQEDLPQPIRRPELKFEGARATHIAFNHSRKWVEVEEGLPAILMPVHNDIAPVGQAGVEAENLVASLRYENLDGQVIHRYLEFIGSVTPKKRSVWPVERQLLS